MERAWQTEGQDRTGPGNGSPIAQIIGGNRALEATDTWKQIVSQKITVDHDRCISCGACLEVCPFMVYEFKKFKTDRKRKKKIPVPVYAEDCFLYDRMVNMLR